MCYVSICRSINETFEPDSHTKHVLYEIRTFEDDQVTKLLSYRNQEGVTVGNLIVDDGLNVYCL